MAVQNKSKGRGTARFQISGIQDSLYRAYSLIAHRRRMSLNALLQEAVEEYMTTRHANTWRECAELENTDEEITAGIRLPIPQHKLEAEIERRARVRAVEIARENEGTASSKSTCRGPEGDQIWKAD